MPMSLSLILIFVSSFILIIGIYRSVSANEIEINQRVQKYTSKEMHTFGDIIKEKTKKSFDLKSLFQQASKVFAAKSYSKSIELELAKADIPLRGEEFILINLLAGIVPALLLGGILRNIPFGLVLGIMGLIIPRVVVNMAKQKRITKFNDQIGDALVVMSNSLRAGFSFLQSMEMVSREMPVPISVEFARTLREMNLGTPTEEAMTHLAKRIGSDDLDLVVTAVLIQRQVGGNLAEVLDNISHTIRERVRIKGEIKTLTAQGRISGMVIGFLPVAITAFLFIINPSYMMTLFTNPIGLMIVIAGVISQVIGVFIIKKIVDIEV
jgi:tight adherence protein B